MKVKTLGSRKRKTIEVTNLILEKLGVEDTLLKLVSFSQTVSVSINLLFMFYPLLLLMPLLFQVSDHVSTDLKIRVESVLKEQEKMWRATNVDLLRKVELLSKEKTENAEEHAAEMDEVIAETKAGAVVAVWEAKLKLAKDIENVGFLNVAGWREALAKLIGKLVNAG